jgi:hypothetical protein
VRATESIWPKLKDFAANLKPRDFAGILVVGRHSRERCPVAFVVLRHAESMTAGAPRSAAAITA